MPAVPATEPDASDEALMLAWAIATWRGVAPSSAFGDRITARPVAVCGTTGICWTKTRLARSCNARSRAGSSTRAAVGRSALIRYRIASSSASLG